MYEKHIRTISQGLILVALVLALIAAALWLRPNSVEPRAQAAGRVIAADPLSPTFDSGRQRLEILDELRAVNSRLDRLEKGFRGGEFQVQIIPPKEAPASKGAP
jgi:hypothetical protein